MAQPSQEFPPWLTPSLVQITDAAGAVATETTVVYVPPTYFGPSIPLGSLYVFGGTTEPPTIVLPGESTAVPSQITTTAIPTTTTQLTTTVTPTTTVLTSTSPSTTATPTSVSVSISASSVSVSSSSLSSQSTSVQSSFSFSTTPSTTQSITSSTPTPSNPSIVHSSGLTRGQLVGVIVASILGLIFFFVLALFLFLCLKGRRNRRQFATLTPIDEDYYIVPSGGRLPGEGSPRHSGEEADPFLQQSSSRSRGTAAAAAAGAGVGAAAMTQVPSQAASHNGSNRVPPPNPNATNGSNSSGSTNSNASGFGVLLDRPSLGYLPVMPEQEHEHETVGTPLSPVDMERIAREQVLPDEESHQQYPDEDYIGPYAYSSDLPLPPRLVDPSSIATPLLGAEARPAFVSRPSRLSEKSSFEHENATLMVARRVKAEDLGPRSLSQQSGSSTAGPSSSSNRPSSGLLAALGLSGLANLGIRRMSWFNKNADSPRNSVSTRTHSAERLSEKDVESGRSLLSPDAARAVDSLGQRRGVVGTGPDGLRPHSEVSARSGTSGGTVYHDAASSLIPGTPAPLPRALTPTEGVSMPIPEHAWISSPLSQQHHHQPPHQTQSQPPAYSSPTMPSFPTPPQTDILDMPAPAALNHFSSLSSIKETPTGSSTFSTSKPAPFLPPGLESTIRPVGWSVSSNSTDVDAAEGEGERDLSASGVSFAFRRSFSGLGMDLGAGMGGMNLGMGGAAGLNDAISIDILEEAPPDAELGWRTIAAAAGSGGGLMGPGRRGTFGLYTPAGPGIPSDHGSLHSMASDFSRSLRSTGSAPAARRDLNLSGSVNSTTSSRPSVGAYSVAVSMGSGVSLAHSLVRQGSLSADEGRRGGAGGRSPALSAFGGQRRAGASSGSASREASNGTSEERSAQEEQGSALALHMIPTIGAPPSAHLDTLHDGTPSKHAQTIRSVGSGSTTVGNDTFSTLQAGEGGGRLSPLSMTFSMDLPWAGGLPDEP
ncbi:hypothetical protein D9613_008032 [Agrocybe pediades]|uniref:Uncharacterized protein n=1 Tax=Agrocybe pediades TaxID=84607 RepID=A0A8H4VL77_9AGAR|nr:hypothetical protein D9613_008032 [Agrocybe pediades]